MSEAENPPAVTLAQQLETATDINACFCIRCGQPDEPELHDRERCLKPDRFPVAAALEAFDTSCEEEPDLGDHARALHCAMIASRMTADAMLSARHPTQEQG